MRKLSDMIKGCTDKTSSMGRGGSYKEGKTSFGSTGKVHFWSPAKNSR
jgi:hypothetical protein